MSETAELPRVEKRIVYLDQFAVSNMAKSLMGDGRATGKELRAWRGLFSRLDYLVRLQLVACPYSSIQVFESMVAPHLEHAILRVMRRLSGELSFIERPQFEQRLLESGALAWLRGASVARSLPPLDAMLNGDRTAWLGRFSLSMRSDWHHDQIEHVRVARDEGERDLAGVFERWRRDRPPFEPVFHEEAMNLGPSMARSLNRRLRREAMFGPPTNSPFLRPPSAAEHDLTLLFERFLREGLSLRAASERVAEFVQSEVQLEMPSNRLRAMLLASVAREAANGAKRPPNRGTLSDIAAVSLFLPYCDAMLVDNKVAALLRSQRLAKEVGRYRCRVFSWRSRDFLVAWLHEIEQQASQAHIELARSVYAGL